MLDRGAPLAASVTLLVVGPVDTGEVSATVRTGPYGDSDPTDNTVSTPVTATP